MAQTAPEVAAPPVVARRPLQKRSARKIAIRMLADGMAVSAALFAASIIRFEILGASPASKVDYALLTALATPVWVILFWLYGLYEPRQVLSPVNEFKQVFHGAVAGTTLIFIADSLLELKLARGWIILSMLCGFVLVGSERLAIRKSLHYLRRRGSDVSRVIVVGANHEARTVAQTLERETWLGYQILGYLDDVAPAGQEVAGGRTVLGRTTELKELVEEHDASLILVAATTLDTARLNRLFWDLQDVDVDVQITSGTIDLLATRMVVQSVAGVPLIYVRRSGMDRIQRTVKRTMDVLGSALGLVLLAPAFGLIAACIKLDSPGSAFFTQLRIGKDGKPFRVWKFRTMDEDAEDRLAQLEHLSEGPGLLFKLKEDPRITRVGMILRRYSLDELPQLANVLRGDMSLVGPRPALPSEVEQYDDWVRNRLNVRPGITGLWQVSGRVETSFSDYVRYDLFYIRNWSLSLDLWVLWRTLRAVMTTEGAH
ncbi:sugar transferase [soil metagenome]